MNRLSNVSITGFWGDKKLSLDFHSDVNFLIGVNGSGKTTAINMIAAALDADFATLDRFPFERIDLTLESDESTRRPQIQIVKSKSKRSPYPSIVYRIKEMASAKFVDYSLDEFEEDRLLRSRYPSRYYRAYMSRMNRGIIAKLRDLINTSWLSIHRATPTFDPESPMALNEERSYESSVDQKLNELNNQLIKYFSVLGSRVSKEIADFQKNIIVSLVTEQTQDALFSSLSKLDLKEEKEALLELFYQLEIKDHESVQKLNNHYKRVQKALNRFRSEKSFTFSDFAAMSTAFSSHKVVKDWYELRNRRGKILRPQDKFIDVLNGLYQRKQAKIDEHNEISVVTQSGKRLALNDLSSGEKQLLIILGEALLQQGSQWVYIADEPELSLHVTWQEKLIENLRELNSRAQIICATHSPDIVSVYGDRVFDMEAHIQ